MLTLPIQRASASLRRELTHSRRKFSRIPSRCFASQAPADLHPVTSLPKPRLNYKKMATNATYQSHNAFNRRAKIPIGAAQHIPRLYEKQKALTNILDEKRHARTVHGDKIRKASNTSDRAELVAQAKALKDEITNLEKSLEEVEDSLYKHALAMPNDTHPDVPIGPESAAAIIAHHGPETLPASPERDHIRIATQLGLVDLEAGAAVSGTSWYFLKNEGALLELALTNYAMSIAIKHGFTPVTTPDVVRTDIASRCGFQPRDEDANPPVSQMYHITQAPSLPELVLAGTAEIPLAGMFANRILEEEKLPLRVVGLGRAFRAEAGARGADTRGLYRVHQFTKLELFVVSSETESERIMEELKAIQAEIFSGLNLAFRVLDMPTEELGASAYRKYDIEAWMPGRGSWGEISSTSNCTDYQSRRLHIRYRRSTGVPFAHTLNGTAAAIPRLIVALIENGARFDDAGNAIGLDLPKVLKPFWVQGGGRDVITWV